MRLIAFFILAVAALMAVAPASAQDTALRPKGAVPMLDGCNVMMGYPDCHPDRVYVVPSPSAAGPTGAVTHRRHRAVTQNYLRY